MEVDYLMIDLFILKKMHLLFLTSARQKKTENYKKTTIT
jgi:hypothetical protein